MNIESIIKRYKEMGVRLTPQRLAILRSLDGDRSHPSAVDIYNRLKGEYPSLSLTTVYNTLQVLKDMGEVTELTLNPAKSLYDPDTSPHGHAYCIHCERVDDLPGLEPPEEVAREATALGYEVKEVATFVYGVCKECREKGPADSEEGD